MSNMVINTNIMALNSHNALKQVGNAQSTAAARLSSGKKINSAADDAAGLAISEKMRAQIRGLDMGSKNAQDGISLVQTAEGGLSQVDEMMQRIRELTVQAANDTNTTDSVESAANGNAPVTGDRSKVLTEVNQLIDEIGVTADRVKFNNRTLLDGSLASTKNFQLQVSANKEDTAKPGVNLMQISVDIDLSSSTGIAGALKTDLDNNFTADSTSTDINKYLGTVDEQLTKVTTARATLGAYQNRLNYTITANDTTSENLSAASSRITDADMATEMMNLTKANVLQQAATSMLAQANQSPQNILRLLQ